MSLNRNNDFQYSVDINHNNQTADLIQRPLDQIHNIEDINIIKNKIEIISRHLKPHIIRILNSLLQNNPINAKTICDFIIAEQNEMNIRESTKETKIKKIVHLSKYFQHQKTFYDMTKDG